METFKAAVNLALGLLIGASATKAVKEAWKLVRDTDDSVENKEVRP